MKKTFALISFILLTCCVSLPAYADWRFGLMASYDNTGAVWNLNGENYGTRNISGFSAGPAIAYEFIDYFSVQSGLYFSMNGFATAAHSFIKDAELKAIETARLFYVHLPLYAVGQLPLKDDATLLLEVGPHLGCGVAAHITREYDYKGQTITEYDDAAFDEDISRFNATLHMAIGAEYMGARIMAGYNLGLFNMALDPGEQLHSGGFFISVGYLF